MRLRVLWLFVLIVLLGVGPVLAQTAAPEDPIVSYPEPVKQTIITRYFDDSNLFTILKDHYPTQSILLIVLLMLGGVVVRNYAKNLAGHEQRIFDTLKSNSILIFDSESNLRFINRAAKHLLNLDEYVTMQEKSDYYLKRSPSPEILEIYNELINTRHGIEREIIFNHAKTMRTLVVKGYPLFSDTKRLEGFILMIADITEAIEKDRRINWSGVAQHVAHKAKTPLSTITLTAQHLEMLINDTYQDSVPDLTKLIDRIVNESRRLNDIVMNLTRLANKERLNLLPNDVNHLLLSIAEDYRAKVAQNITINTFFAQSLPKVGIDIAHFPEAVQNLMDNAIRAIGAKDGKVTLTTALGQWIDRPGEYVEISIQDTGIGMSDDIKKSIFRPFSTHSQGGTGLGLVIVQKIIQEHGGEITFTSTLGLGTAFLIRLPVTKY